MTETRDPRTGLTDREAYRLICAGDGGVFAVADAMGIERRHAYNIALGRAYAREQYQRCISNPRALEWVEED